MKKFLLLGFLLVLPLLFNPFTGAVDFVKLLALALVALVLGLSSGPFHVHSQALSVSLCGLIVFGGLSTVFAENIDLAFWGSSPRHFGFFVILLGVFLAFGVAHLAKKKDFFDSLLKVLMWAGAASSLLALFLITFFETSIFEGRLSGATGNPNILGQFLAVTLFCTFLNFKNKNQWLVGLLGALQLFVLMETGNRASWLVLTIVLVVYLATHRLMSLKMWAGFAVATLMLGGLYWDRLISFTSIQTRLELYGSGLRLISENPLFGVGFEHVAAQLQVPSSYTLFPDRIHQVFLDVAAASGILAAFCLLIITIMILLIFLKKAKSLGFVFLVLILSLQSSFFSILDWTLYSVFFGIALSFKSPFSTSECSH